MGGVAAGVHRDNHKHALEERDRVEERQIRADLRLAAHAQCARARELERRRGERVGASHRHSASVSCVWSGMAA